jgi:hypothetical protein
MTRDRYDPRWQVSPRRPDGSRGVRGPHIGSVRITPIRVVLAVALAGTFLYIIYAITVRDASQIPMLASGAAVLGIVFTALAVGGVIECYRAGRAGDGRRAMLLAIAGGLASMVAAGCFAGAMVLALVWSA